MQNVGIICEYNPLHLGHQKQFRTIREQFGDDCGIVCLMSGYYVQRGAPAVFDPALRAKAAVLSGADLVLELPVNYALSSAEGFAAGGVKILSSFCDYLCFGAETPDSDVLLTTARALLSAEFMPVLKEKLATGLSFPAARQAALSALGLPDHCLQQPNDILAVEYCKAIHSQGVALRPFPILRAGAYHDELPDADNPSATSLRRLIESGEGWMPFVPEAAQDCFRSAEIHTLSAGERAILARLRTLTDSEFEALPFGSEGLWRKLMHSCRANAELEQILTSAKSKRYTRSRLNRMILCAFLGIDTERLTAEAPYARILAFNDRGRAILKQAKSSYPLVNAGETVDSPYQILENRCADLYGLFAVGTPGAPGTNARQRVFYSAKEASL